MQGSLYPDGVLVDRTALLRTEVTKAYEILRNRIMMTTRGIYSGGAVTINSVDATRIDLAQIVGFVPNGEYVEVPGTLYSQTLSDYTVDTVNLVCVIYTEVNTGNQPHETQAVTKPTKSDQSYRVRIYTQAEYNALDDTDDNLDNDAKDRILVAAKIVANGSGVDLTDSSVIVTPSYDNILASEPIQLSSITGVTIISVSPDTSTGEGTIEYDDTSSPTYKLRWTPYGGTAGAWIDFTEDSEKNLVDGGGVNFITVLVTLSQLPTIAGTTSETVTINNIYEQEMPRFSAEDLIHRNLMGTGVPSAQNPHAQSVDDLTGADIALVGEHRDVMHCNGIWRNSSPSIFAATINTVSDPLGDTLNITSPVSSDLYYINGRKLNTIDRNSITFKQANFTSGWLGTSHLGAKFYEIYVSDEGSLVPHVKAEFPTSRNCSGVWIVDMSEDHPVGNFDLVVDTTGAYYSFKWDDGQESSIDSSTISVNGQVLRLYSSDGTNWVDIWVNRSATAYPDANLPSSAVATDSVTVYSSLDRDENIQVLSLCYWWEGTRGTVGYEPYEPPASALRKSVDKRKWGNLCVENISDEALQYLTYNHADEQHLSGIIYGRNDASSFKYSSLGGLNINIAGGPYILNGERIEIDGSNVTLSDNSSTLIYLDSNGNYNTLVYSDPSTFNGDLEQAMLYVVGSSFDRNSTAQNEWKSDKQYQNDYPERGVVLYNVITSGGGVTDYNDLARATDQYTERWTVANRRVASAEFNSLYSAFLYFSVYKANTLVTPSVEIKVVGYNELSGAAITIPTGIKISGANNKSEIVFYTSSQLVMSEYGIIENLKMSSGSGRNTGTAVILADNTKVTGCIYDGNTTGAEYVFGASTTISNVVINDNNVSIKGGMFDSSLSSGASANSNWNIIGNRVELNSVPSVPGGVINIQGTAMTIKDNYISTMNTTGITMAGIRSDEDTVNSLPGLRNSIVADNIVYNGDGGQVIPEYGIYVVASETRISGNRIDRKSGDTNETGVGILMVGASNSRDIVVSNNIITNMAAGIWISENGTTGVLRQVKVHDNIIRNSYVKGIYVSALNDLIGLSIEGNNIRDVTRSGVSPSGWPNVSAIDIDKICNNGSSDTNAMTINVCNNTIYNVSHGSQSAYGIDLSFTLATNNSTVDNIRVCGNSISSVLGATASDTEFVKVYFNSSSTNCNFYNISADDNDIVGLSLTSTGEFNGINIENVSSSPLSNVSANDNNISLALVAKYLTAIGVGNGIKLSGSYQYNISSNNIVAPRFGIYTDINSSSGAIKSNTIYSYACGIFCFSADSIVGNNYVQVMTSYEDSSVYGRNGSHGIIPYAGGITTLENHIIMIGNAGNVLRSASTGIYVNGGDRHKVEGNKIEMRYSSVGAVIPNHLLVELLDGANMAMSIKNNDFNNYSHVPSTALGNCIEIDGSLKTSGNTNIHASGNSIFGSINGSWNTLGTAPYEIYVHDITFSYNTIWSSNYVELTNKTTQTPKTYFDNGPGTTNSNWAVTVGVW